MYQDVKSIIVLKSNQGFSLVELLVTVTILGILASLSVSNYNDYKARVYDTYAISAINNMRISFEAMPPIKQNNPPAVATVNFTFNPSGAASCTSTNATPACSSTDLTVINNYLPGYSHPLKVVLSLSIVVGGTSSAGGPGGFKYVTAFHCNGTGSNLRIAPFPPGVAIFYRYTSTFSTNEENNGTITTDYLPNTIKNARCIL